MCLASHPMTAESNSAQRNRRAAIRRRRGHDRAGAGGRIGQIAVGPEWLLVDDRPPERSAGVRTRWPRGQGGSATDGSGSTAARTSWRSTRRRDSARHAIHGTVFDAEWTVDELGPDATTLRCPIDTALGWPFAGTARQTITVTDDGVTCRLSVETDGEPMPASIGWHPWFRKPERLTFDPDAMYGGPGSACPADARATGSRAVGRLLRQPPPVVLHYDARSVAPRSPWRPTATTGSSTTSPPTPRASSRRALRPTPSTSPRPWSARVSRSPGR